MNPPPRHDPYAALRIPNFRWFVGSLMAMTAATQIQAVVVGWQIYDLTHDPLSLGLIGLAEAVPFVAVALFAGHVADRMNRLRISLAALAALFLCSVALLGFSLRPGVITADRVWPIYLVIFLSGIARSFLQPARSALGAELVPRDLYPNAVTWRSSSWQLATVVGPAIGGLVYGFGSATAAYGVDAAIMAAGLIALARMQHPPRPAAPPTEPFMESLTTGIRFVRGQPVILGALSLDLFSVLFGGAVALLPVFAAEILYVGPEGLGVLRAACRWSGSDVAGAGAPSSAPAGRAGAVDRGSSVRPEHHWLRPLTQLPALDCAACGKRHGRYRERGDSFHAAAGVDAGPSPRKGILGECDIHRELERNRSLRIGNRRAAAGCGARRGAGWDCHACGGGRNGCKGARTAPIKGNR